MNNDILESVSQGGYGAYDAEKRRIKEISDELQRLCRLYEAQPRTGQEDRSRFEIEQRVAEQYAKSFHSCRLTRKERKYRIDTISSILKETKADFVMFRDIGGTGTMLPLIYYPLFALCCTWIERFQ